MAALPLERSEPRDATALRRADDGDLFAYARGHDFIRRADDVLWAHEHDGWLISARTGAALAYRYEDTYYDVETHRPLYRRASPRS